MTPEELDAGATAIAAEVLAASTCRHCSKFKASRPRGLCWGCYRQEDIRDLYPMKNAKSNNRGVGLGVAGDDEPEYATEAEPQSAEKIEVLARRAKAGQSLWHRHDGPIERRDLA